MAKQWRNFAAEPQQVERQPFVHSFHASHRRLHHIADAEYAETLRQHSKCTSAALFSQPLKCLIHKGSQVPAIKILVRRLAGRVMPTRKYLRYIIDAKPI